MILIKIRILPILVSHSLVFLEESNGLSSLGRVFYTLASTPLQTKSFQFFYTNSIRVT